MCFNKCQATRRAVTRLASSRARFDDKLAFPLSTEYIYTHVFWSKHNLAYRAYRVHLSKTNRLTIFVSYATAFTLLGRPKLPGLRNSGIEPSPQPIREAALVCWSLHYLLQYTRIWPCAFVHLTTYENLSYQTFLYILNMSWSWSRTSMTGHSYALSNNEANLQSKYTLQGTD